MRFFVGRLLRGSWLVGIDSLIPSDILMIVFLFDLLILLVVSSVCM